MLKTIEKIRITSILEIKTGLHIGKSEDFSPIGAIDSPIIRDLLTKMPIIPASSIKGKMRTLLVRNDLDRGNIMKDISQDSPGIKRLFGCTKSENNKSEIVLARLNFRDCFFESESARKIKDLETDGFMTEAKFENTINRLTGIANPRQIERVIKGSKFVFEVIYNVENLEEIKEDMELFKKGIILLKWDYLGGSGTRGYGKVEFKDFKFEKLFDNNEINIEDIKEIFSSQEVLL